MTKDTMQRGQTRRNMPMRKQRLFTNTNNVISSASFTPQDFQKKVDERVLQVNFDKMRIGFSFRTDKNNKILFERMLEGVEGDEGDGESKRMRLASDMALVHAMENVATQLNKTNGHLDKHSFLMEKYLLVLEKQNLLTEKKLQDSDSSSESESHDDKDLLKLFE